MKKTFWMLIVSTCGFSSAATNETTLDMEWDENASVTVALTLNLEQIYTVGSTTPLFSLSDGNKSMGVAFDVYNGEIKCNYLKNGTYDWNGEKDVPVVDAKYVTLVFSSYCSDAAKGNFAARGYINFWDESFNEMRDKSVTLSNKTLGQIYFEGYNSLSYDAELVKAYEVSTTYVDKTAAKELAKNLLTQSVPEPTTATLSLLALAGLAARRRRH